MKRTAQYFPVVLDVVHWNFNFCQPLKNLIWRLHFYTNQVSILQHKIEDLESEIQSLQDDLILSHRAYEQCKKRLEERESSDDQTETSTLSFEVKGRPQKTATLDIDVKPQVTTLDINVSPHQSFDYNFAPQNTTAEFEIQPQTTVEYMPQQTSAAELGDVTSQTTTTLDIDVQRRHETTEMEIDIERNPRPIPVSSWTTGSVSSFQVFRDRKYGPVQFTLEEEEDGEYEIAQIESRRNSRRRWKY